MLRGNYLATVDEKGRLKIPADFLAELRKSGTKFYITSTKGDRAAIYPNESLGRNRKEAGESFYLQRGETKISIADELLRSGGRGGWLGAHSDSTRTAGIGGDEGEVDVQGQLTYLEVWNHSRFLDQMNRNPMTAEDEKALDDLGI
jgi:MraZ protein